MPHHVVMLGHAGWFLCGRIAGKPCCMNIVCGLQFIKAQRKGAALRSLHVEEVMYMSITQHTNDIF
jgi:hypothetical protein